MLNLSPACALVDYDYSEIKEGGDIDNEYIDDDVTNVTSANVTKTDVKSVASNGTARAGGNAKVNSSNPGY